MKIELKCEKTTKVPGVGSCRWCHRMAPVGGLVEVEIGSSGRVTLYSADEKTFRRGRSYAFEITEIEEEVQRDS